MPIHIVLLSSTNRLKMLRKKFRPVLVKTRNPRSFFVFFFCGKMLNKELICFQWFSLLMCVECFTVDGSLFKIVVMD